MSSTFHVTALFSPFPFSFSYRIPLMLLLVSSLPLSLRSCQGFMHMKFAQYKDGKYVLGQNSPPFDTIPEVIHFYTTHKLPIRGAEHLSLLFPVLVQTLWLTRPAPSGPPGFHWAQTIKNLNVWRDLPSGVPSTVVLYWTGLLLMNRPTTELMPSPTTAVVRVPSVSKHPGGLIHMKCNTWTLSHLCCNFSPSYPFAKSRGL